MKLAWLTDVHLNFLKGPQLDEFRRMVARAGGDAVLLTGDIAVGPTVERELVALEAATKVPIHFVLGNHDYWQSSFAAMRERMTQLTKSSKRLRWAEAAGVVALTERTGLVGADGWADGRLGDWDASKIMMNDWVRVEDFAYMGKSARRAKIQELAAVSAAHLERVLPEALGAFEKVVVITHVPPWKEAAWHDGEESGDDWLPHMTCKAVGDVIERAAEKAPHREVVVLCGHTHGHGEARVRPNLTVLTGGATYGKPGLQPLIEVA